MDRARPASRSGRRAGAGRCASGRCGHSPAGPAEGAAGWPARTRALYPHSLVKEIIPFIEKHYRVIADKDSRAIAGLSMGGGHTVQATNNNPGVFGWIAVWSAGGQDTPEFAAALTKVKDAGAEARRRRRRHGTDYRPQGFGDPVRRREESVGLNATYVTRRLALHYWFIDSRLPYRRHLRHLVLRCALVPPQPQVAAVFERVREREDGLGDTPVARHGCDLDPGLAQDDDLAAFIGSLGS